MTRRLLACPLLALALSCAVPDHATAAPTQPHAKTPASTWGASKVWGVPRSECFPVERLSPALRREAESMLLAALDGEALYTLVGGVKPMSTGWLSAKSDGTPASTARLEELRCIVASLRCGEEIQSHLHQYARLYDGQIMLEGVMLGQGAMRRLITSRQAFWAKRAVTPSSPLPQVVTLNEYAPRLERSRGYGLLFGYPEHAVDFFVSAVEREDASPEPDPLKKLVPRDFLSIPTASGPAHNFVYAVPKGQAPNAADIALRQECAPILAEYRRRRARYIGPGKPGVLKLVRDWFSNSEGRCSPQFARLKYLHAAQTSAKP